MADETVTRDPFRRFRDLGDELARGIRREAVRPASPGHRSPGTVTRVLTVCASCGGPVEAGACAACQADRG